MLPSTMSIAKVRLPGTRVPYLHFIARLVYRTYVCASKLSSIGELIMVPAKYCFENFSYCSSMQLLPQHVKVSSKLSSF